MKTKAADIFKDSENFCFFHIPRTGGISLRTWMDMSRNFGFEVYHINMEENNEKYMKNFDRDENERVITILRNPFSRLLSCYYFFLNGGLSDEDVEIREKFIYPFDGFGDFLRNGLIEAKEKVPHFKSQSSWLYNEEEEFIPDVVFRTKSLRDSWFSFRSMFDVEKTISYSEMFIRNTSEKKNSWREDYSKDLILRVSGLYSQDVKLTNELFFGGDDKFLDFNEELDCFVFSVDKL